MSSRTMNIYLVCSLVDILLILLNIKNVQSSRAVSRLLVVRVGPCYERKNTEVMKLSEMSLIRNKYDAALSGLFNVTRDIDNGWIIKATMQKCNDVRNLDTCDLYKVINLLKAGCTDKEDSKFIKTLFQYVTPKLHCPIKAGSYKITNFPFFKEVNDLTAEESKISTSVFGYTFKMEGFSEDEERLFCLDSQLRLLYVRNHDWVGDKRLDATVMSGALGDQNLVTTTGTPGEEIYEENEEVEAK